MFTKAGESPPLLLSDNIKHFTKRPFVVTPAEMVAILGL